MCSLVRLLLHVDCDRQSEVRAGFCIDIICSHVVNWIPVGVQNQQGVLSAEVEELPKPWK